MDNKRFEHLKSVVNLDYEDRHDLPQMYFTWEDLKHLIAQTEKVYGQADLLRQYRQENKQIKEAYQDREDDIKSLEQLLRRVQRETSDYSTRITIERALTITDS